MNAGLELAGEELAAAVAFVRRCRRAFLGFKIGLIAAYLNLVNFVRTKGGLCSATSGLCLLEFPRFALVGVESLVNLPRVNNEQNLGQEAS
jgi:hypothetical protein